MSAGAAMQEALDSDGFEIFSPHNKMRLALAARVAAGMCANPNTYDQDQWQAVTAYHSLQVADKLIMLVGTGGC